VLIPCCKCDFILQTVCDNITFFPLHHKDPSVGKYNR
jgi:hypothetical protein